jgi:hypothetical protein
MTASRYFYTDPLAAAWMAKHFGMKYQTKDGYAMRVNGDTVYIASVTSHTFTPTPQYEGFVENKSCSATAPTWFDARLSGSGQYFDGGIYLHPDSVPLLLPRDGDMVVVHPNLPDAKPDDPYRHKLKRLGWISFDSEHHNPEEGVYFVGDGPETWAGLIRAREFIQIIQRNGIPFHQPQSEQAP